MVDWKSKALIIFTSETENKEQWCRSRSGVTLPVIQSTMKKNVCH